MSLPLASATLLNAKLAETLRTMPDKHEFAFSVARSSSIDLSMFVRRFGALPDGEAQVYSFDASTLETFLVQKTAHASSNSGPTAIFQYTLCVSPMAPRQIWAVVFCNDGSVRLDGPDPLIALHAPWVATDGMLVMQFTDEERMRAFASRV